VVEDTELGTVIQLQGDQRKNVSQFLVQVSLASEVHSRCFSGERVCSMPGGSSVLLILILLQSLQPVKVNNAYFGMAGSSGEQAFLDLLHPRSGMQMLFFEGASGVNPSYTSFGVRLLLAPLRFTFKYLAF
jgi:hypothetical protein